MDYKKLYEQSQKENEELKNEQFDEMEKIAKQQGMCLVDIPIFDKLIEKEKENEEKNHTILTWKMSASLKDTEIDELKEELEELKKMNKTNYDEKEKMKAFLGELRINVVKKD